MNVTETMNDTADTAVQKAKPVLERINSLAGDAADKAYTMKNQARDWLGTQGDQLSAKQKQLVDDTSKYVSENPLKSLGIAVVAALIVGRLMK